MKRTTFADVRCVSLGSRRNLCLNQEVTRLRSDGAMSDKCLDLQKEKSGTSRASGQPKGAARGCPFLSADTQRHFSDHAQVRWFSGMDRSRATPHAAVNGSMACRSDRRSSETLRNSESLGRGWAHAHTTGRVKLRARPRCVRPAHTTRRKGSLGIGRVAWDFSFAFMI